MLKQIFSASLLLTLSCSAVSADGTTTATETFSNSVTGPQEVGTTTMPPGNYLIKEQTSGKTFELMVSTKGTMILAPAPTGATVTAATAAPNAAATQPAQTNLTGLGSSALKKMVQEQVTKGVTNAIEKDATNSLGKFIK